MFWRKKLEDSDYKLFEEVLASKDVSVVKRKGLKFECQYGDWMVIFDMRNLKSALLKSKDTEDKRKIIEDFIGSKMEALKSQMEQNNPVEYLRIALKTDDEINGMNSQVPDNLKDKVQLIATSIGAGLAMVSVFDSPDRMEFLTTQHSAEWGVDKEILIGAGFANLSSIAEQAKIEFVEKNIAQIFTEERHYEAALILTGKIRERLEREFEEKIVFAIPTRDHLFAVSAKDKNAVNALRKLSKKIFNDEDYKLTPKMLQINEEGEIQEFT